ncbi:MAG: ABC transporter ATP-binding protein [Armatimonadetes bacterium]|nr:ABC transporter ATP-binding protein [Armatimonadota bacterium]
MAKQPYYELKETLLKVENVSLELGGRQILRDVNVEIKNVVRPGLEQGQVVSFLGPSGMGKTRLFRIISGLDNPDSGTVLVGPNQVPVTKGSVGVVAQNYPLFEHRTVISNLVIAGRQSGLDGSAARDKADSFLKRFDLADQAGKYPAQLSGGQRQRVAIAQQFMCSEHFLLMDEPFSGLDVNQIRKVIDLIHEVSSHDEQLTIIIVTHDIESALEVADTIWVLGRERDSSGQPLPGANIVKTYDLISCGLAWREDVSQDPELIRLKQEIRELFPNL